MDWLLTLHQAIKNRVIIHAQTGSVLTTNLRLINPYINGGSFKCFPVADAQASTWVVDVDMTLTLRIAGLARHMYLSNSTVAVNGAPKKHLDLHLNVDSDGVVNYSPAIIDNPAPDAYIDMQDRRGVHFLAVPTTFELSTSAMVIGNIVAANAPVFLHSAKTYLPVDIAGYLSKASFIDPDRSADKTILDEKLMDPTKASWSMTWNPPASTQLPQPVVYVRVTSSRELMMTGFTDIKYSMFYASIISPSGDSLHGTGWVKVTLRMDNETNTLDSVLFKATKRVGNTSSTFTNLIDPDKNPLTFRLTPDGISRLHLYISNGPTNTISPTCPITETPDFANLGDWKTADGKAGALDSSSCYQILQADMIQPDDKRNPPSIPPWALYQE